MNVFIRSSALKDFKKLPKSEKHNIQKKIKSLQDFPNLTNIKKLVNYTPKYRLRVGNYRILFDITDNQIEVARIKHRQKNY